MTNLHLARALVAAHRCQLESEARTSRLWASARRNRHAHAHAHAPLTVAPERTSVAAVERAA